MLALEGSGFEYCKCLEAIFIVNAAMHKYNLYGCLLKSFVILNFLCVWVLALFGIRSLRITFPWHKSHEIEDLSTSLLMKV